MCPFIGDLFLFEKFQSSIFLSKYHQWIFLICFSNQVLFLKSDLLLSEIDVCCLNKIR